MATMTPLEKLIGFLLLAFFLIIVGWALYNPQGFFSKVSSTALGAEKFVPTAAPPNLQATPLSGEITNARDSLLSNMEAISEQDKTDCLFPMMIS